MTLASEQLAVRAVVDHAIDEPAARFHGHFGFRSLSSTPRTPMVTLAELGTAIAGTILVSDLVSGNGTYVAAMIVLAAVAVAGLLIAVRLPPNPIQTAETAVAPPATEPGALDTAV